MDKSGNKQNVLPRKIIEETLKAISPSAPELAGKLTNIFNTKPIEKPLFHVGGDKNDHYFINMTKQDIEHIISILGFLEASSVDAEGNTTPEASYYATLLDTWNDISLAL